MRVWAQGELLLDPNLCVTCPGPGSLGWVGPMSGELSWLLTRGRVKMLLLLISVSLLTDPGETAPQRRPWTGVIGSRQSHGEQLHFLSTAAYLQEAASIAAPPLATIPSCSPSCRDSAGDGS